MTQLDEVWMVVLPDNKGVVYEIGTSATDVWNRVIASDTIGTGVTKDDLYKKGYRAKKVSIWIT